MENAPTPGGPWVFLVPLLIVGMVILRNARARKLKVERLWIAPTIILAMTCLMFAFEPAPTLGMVAADIAVLGAGGLLGWWRGRLTNITVDPDTHELTSRASPWGMLLILLVFGARYALRSFGTETAGFLHVSVREVGDALMLLAVGIVCAQRLEIALRATRLLTEARAKA